MDVFGAFWDYLTNFSKVRAQLEGFKSVIVQLFFDLSQGHGFRNFQFVFSERKMHDFSSSCQLSSNSHILDVLLNEYRDAHAIICINEVSFRFLNLTILKLTNPTQLVAVWNYGVIFIRIRFAYVH